jgi:hypothetical protein
LTLYPHLNPFHLPSPFHCYPQTLYLLTVLSFIINIEGDVQSGFSIYSHCGYSSLWFVQPLPSLSLTSLPPISIFQQLSIHMLISSMFTSMVCHITYALTFFFSFPLSEFHRVISLLQTCSPSEFVHDHARFCIHFTFWIYPPCVRENMWLCVSVPGLLHLTWCPPIASIYLNHIVIPMAE